MRYYAFSLVGFAFFWNPLLRRNLLEIDNSFALYLEDICSAACILLYFGSFLSDFFPKLLKVRDFFWNITLFFCLCVFPTFVALLQCNQAFWIAHIVVSNLIASAILDNKKYLFCVVAGFLLSFILHIVCDRGFCLDHVSILYAHLASVIFGIVCNRVELRISNESIVSQLQAKLENYKFFTQYVSHELRIPLQGIRGVAGLLLDGSEYNLSQYLNILQASCTQLLIIASSILDFSKFRSQYSTLNRTHCILKNIIDNVVTEMMALSVLQHTPINVYCDLPEVYMDAVKVTHILRNLISNALRNTKNGTINIQVFHMKGEKLYISVTDTGVGIGVHEINKIFNKFTQTSIPNSIDASGIGLFIVSHFVNIHKGKVWVEPNIPQGTIFSLQFDEVFLPSSKSNHVKQKRPENSDEQNIFWHNVTAHTLHFARLWHRKVLLCALVVDDDELSLLSSKIILENAGFTVLKAKNCSTAVEILKNQEVHLVLLDVVIVGENIRDCLKQIIRANSKASIILQSGMNQSFVKEIRMHKGVIAYLSKPYGPQDLEKILRALIKKD